MFRTSVILVLLVYLATFSYQNFLSSEPKLNYNSDIQEVNDHGDNTLFWAGFFHGLGIFQNVTHKKECLAILPVVHDNWAAIRERVRNITDFKEMVEVFKFISQKLEEINKKCEETRPQCKLMWDDIREVKDNVKKYLQTEGMQAKIYQHFFQNLGTVIQKWQNIGDHCRDRDWFRAGCAYGDVIRFVILWDYQPPKDNSHALRLFDDSYFNRPPFNF
jgi:hypothetical protein